MDITFVECQSYFSQPCIDGETFPHFGGTYSCDIHLIKENKKVGSDRPVPLKVYSRRKPIIESLYILEVDPW